MHTVSHELIAAHEFKFSPLGAPSNVTLSQAQQDVVNEFLRPTAKDLQVIAGAGAGKTATIVASVTQVLTSGLCKEKELLLVSFSAGARASLQTKLGGAINDTDNTIHTFSSLALRITGKSSKDCCDTKDGAANTRALMKRAETNAGGASKEWEETFFSGGEEDEDGGTSDKLVLELSRLHSRGHLVEDADLEQHVPDATVRTILINFDKMLKQAGLFTFGQNAVEALRLLRSQKAPPQYKLVIVDEAQDNDIVQLELATLLSQGGRLVLVGDPRQCIHRWRGAEPDFFIDFHSRGSVRVMDLTDNYRSRDEVVAFGNAVSFHMGRSRTVTKAMTSNSNYAALYFAKYQQISKRIKLQTDIATLQHDQVAVLARTWRPLWDVYKALIIAGVRVSFKKHHGWLRTDLEALREIWSLRELARARQTSEKGSKFMYEMALSYLRSNPESTFYDYLSTVPIKAPKSNNRNHGQSQPAVRLSTIQSVKGEEFDQVWLLDTGVNPRAVPGMSLAELAALEEDELRVYYTGVTRAKRKLVLVGDVRGFDGRTIEPSNYHHQLLALLQSGAAVHPRCIP